MVRFVALWWARAAETRLTEISTTLHCSGGQTFAAGINLRRQTRGIGRDIEHYPMPPAAACWRIGVVDGQGKAFRSGRYA